MKRTSTPRWPFGFSRTSAWATQWTAYTSPNAGYSTVKEILFKSRRVGAGALRHRRRRTRGPNRVGPGGTAGRRRAYAELGIGPSWTLGGKGPHGGRASQDWSEPQELLRARGRRPQVRLLRRGRPVHRAVRHGGAEPSLAPGISTPGPMSSPLATPTEAFNVKQDATTGRGAVTALFGIGVSY